jgi:hypothetical protein
MHKLRILAKGRFTAPAAQAAVGPEAVEVLTRRGTCGQLCYVD